MTVDLHTELVSAEDASPEQLALVLHGVFGSGANWRLFMRNLVKERPEWGFVLCDLRGHAGSLGGTPPHDLDAMADDLLAVAERQSGSVRAVIGHSLGGKVALRYGVHAGDDLEQVWVLDSQPGARPFRGNTVEVLELLERLPRVFSDRNAFVREVEAAGQPRAVAAWLAMNVRRDDRGDLVLNLDLPALRAVLEDFYRTDAWELLEGGRHTHVVVGTASHIWGEGDLERLDQVAERSPTTFVHRLEGAGHFINVDAPDELRAILSREL